MLRLAPLVLATVIALPAAAHAGAYIGLGVGPSPSVGGDRVGDTLEGDGRTGRLFLGYRLSQFSIEGQVTASSTTDSLTRQEDFSARHLALMGKYSHPIDSGFEAYGKLGVVRTSLGNDYDADLSGNGWGGAVGVELRIPLGISSVAFGVEYGRTSVDLELPDGTEEGLTTGQWMLSVTLGM